MKSVIGIDFGTQGCRAVLVDCETGKTLNSHSVAYRHGILPGDLAEPSDYESALLELLEAVAKPEYRDTIACIGIDATSYSMVLTDSKGVPLSYLPEFQNHPHAKIKMWKRRTASKQTDQALEEALRTNRPFLARTGGTISPEWALPKLMETLDEAPEVMEKADLAFDLCDALTYYLTGNLTRSKGSMSFKALWAEDLGFPEESYLDSLRQGLGKRYRHLLRGSVLPPGTVAGNLKASLCQRFGFPDDVIVSAGILDGHTGLTALGMLQPGDAALIIGTSNVVTVQTDTLHEVIGICGIAEGAFHPEYFGIDSGQGCTGEMLDWYIHNAIPQSILKEAEDRKVDVHTVLCEKIKTPWKSDVIATDWFAGSRNAPCDPRLRGSCWGLTNQTAPEDLYLSLLQSIVCGTREILEVCRSYGINIKRMRASGGISGKNPVLMQLYADVLNLEILVGQNPEGPALGTAIYAAAAAGIYPTIESACTHMGIRDYVTYRPDVAHRGDYEALYLRNHQFRKMLMQFADSIL